MRCISAKETDAFKKAQLMSYIGKYLISLNEKGRLIKEEWRRKINEDIG
jgi:hypothetical protein